LKEFKGCPDTDKDGIVDTDDACPTAKGLAAHKGCPDTDGDLVFDDVDQCPKIPGAPDNKGCPWPDSDNDGTPDNLDSCKSVRGVPSNKGCPAPVVLAAVERRILQKAFASLEFETGKEVIKAKSIPSLKALAKLLVEHKAEWTIKLSGHTDNQGTEEGNMILSEKRAKAVQTFLVKQGVPEKNTSTVWFGQSKPVTTNTTKMGHQKNRRVEMTVLMKE